MASFKGTGPAPTGSIATDKKAGRKGTGAPGGAAGPVVVVVRLKPLVTRSDP